MVCGVCCEWCAVIGECDDWCVAVCGGESVVVGVW